MGSYLSYCFNENIKNEIIKESADECKTDKEKEFSVSFDYKSTYHIENVNNSLQEIAQFPSGIIIVLFDVEIHFFDKNFNLLQKIEKKQDKNKDHIYINNEKIFAIFGIGGIKVCSFVFNEKNKNDKIQINLLGEIEDAVDQMAIINNEDIIFLYENKIVIYQRSLEKSDNNLYIYSKINEIKESIKSFLVTKDNKNLIIFFDQKIEIREIISLKKLSLIYFPEKFRASYLVDEHTLAVQYKFFPMNKLEPSDRLLLYDIKNLNKIKEINEVLLDTYEPVMVTKNFCFHLFSFHKKFLHKINKIFFYSFRYRKYCKLETKMGQYKWDSKMCILNNNEICFYNKDSNEVEIYIINEKYIQK